MIDMIYDNQKWIRKIQYDSVVDPKFKPEDFDWVLPPFDDDLAVLRVFLLAFFVILIASAGIVTWLVLR